MAEKITISLTSVFSNPKGKRARRAMAKIKAEIAGRYHLLPENVVISQRTNHAVFAKGFEKIPRRISLMLDEDKGIVRAYIAGEKIPKKEEKKKKEDKKEEKKKEEKKEEKKESGAEEEIERKKKEKRAMERAAEKTAIKMKTDRV